MVLWSILAEYRNQSVANAIRLLLLTGSRRSEVLYAAWDQLDLEKEIWTKPAHTTKQKRVEHLPLSSLAVEILKRMKVQAESKFLFPGRISRESLQDIENDWHTISTRAGLQMCVFMIYATPMLHI